jgi:hypothetical protein
MKNPPSCATAGAQLSPGLASVREKLDPGLRRDDEMWDECRDGLS